MKLVIITILIFALFILGVLTIKSFKESHRLAGTVRRILVIGFTVILLNLIILSTNSELTCKLAYSLYFVCADWLLFNLLYYSLEYIGSGFENHVNRRAMIGLLSLDSVSVLLNNVFGHLFSVHTYNAVNGEIFYRLDTMPAFFTHYIIIIMLVIFCLISLYYRAFNAPEFYRRKYLIIALILTGIIITNIVCMHTAFDFSVLGYAAEAVCLYYCTFVYTPQRLLQKTLYRVAQDMSVALLIIDNDGKKIFGNEYYEQLSGSTSLTDCNGTSLENWCINAFKANSNPTCECIFKHADEEYILNITCQTLTDYSNQNQGAYFLIQDRTEEINKLKKERYMATHDSLTGLYNKQYFCEVARNYINSHTDAELVMICTDIKDFKMINDFFGTVIGDNVLIAFAEMLKSKMTEAEVYGRLGNDIFAILMPKNKFDEKSFIKDAQSAFSSCMNKSAAFPTINYVGVYEITERDIPITVMCDRARMAITSIKGDYHKRTAYYNKALRDNILNEQELIRDLNNAIENNQLKMYLQPQMSADGMLLGAEALVRWDHPTKGQIMPANFIPIFEKNGLISDVDKYIWEIACKQLRKWKDEGKDDLYISVNISPRDFYFLNIYQIFTELIEKYEINPSALKLEITETAVVMDFQRQLELISRLRQTGFVVEMDDFGSGYSSLNMLKDIHVDVLKIDMAFLKKAEDEERSKKILQMIISLSKQLGMPVITEGVETAEQIAFLSEMGCDMFQGYFFAKPMEVEQFEQLYMEQKRKLMKS